MTTPIAIYLWWKQLETNNNLDMSTLYNIEVFKTLPPMPDNVLYAGLSKGRKPKIKTIIRHWFQARKLHWYLEQYNRDDKCCAGIPIYENGYVPYYCVKVWDNKDTTTRPVGWYTVTQFVAECEKRVRNRESE